MKGRPSKTKICPVTSDITIHLKKDDYIHYDKVDTKGYIRPYKRDWIGKELTVLVGTFKVSRGSISINVGTPMFICEVLRNTYVSSISSKYAGQDVTVIVHGVTKV